MLYASIKMIIYKYSILYMYGSKHQPIYSFMNIYVYIIHMYCVHKHYMHMYFVCISIDIALHYFNFHNLHIKINYNTEINTIISYYIKLISLYVITM